MKYKLCMFTSELLYYEPIEFHYTLGWNLDVYKYCVKTYYGDSGYTLTIL